MVGQFSEASDSLSNMDVGKMPVQRIKLHSLQASLWRRLSSLRFLL